LSKHEKTLTAIFAKPTRSDVKWGDVEALLLHLGAEISEGSGSRVRVSLNGAKAVLHRPHPRPEIKKYALEHIRDFLEGAGVTP
jgi:hypothetical protein